MAACLLLSASAALGASVLRNRGDVPTVTISSNGTSRLLRLDGGAALGPGAVSERLIDLRNRARMSTAVTLTTEALASSPLDRDRRNGLRIQVASCPEAWIRGAGGFRCPGGQGIELGWRPVIGHGMRLDRVPGHPGSIAHLILRLRLPWTAPNRMQGQSSQIAYRFGAVA